MARQRPHRRRSKLGTTFKAGRGKSVKKWFGSIRQQDIRNTFKRYQNKKDWKEPSDAIVLDYNEAQKIKYAFEYFHGRPATIQKTSVLVTHRDGLVPMEMTGYLVSSKGYYERHP